MSHAEYVADLMTGGLQAPVQQDLFVFAHLRLHEYSILSRINLFSMRCLLLRLPLVIGQEQLLLWVSMGRPFLLEVEIRLEVIL